MKVRLDFCDFWPGFPKTGNFFYRLLQERFEVEICDRPDFLIFADPGQHVHRLHNCVKIYVALEAFKPDFRWCDYAFTCHYLDDPRHLRHAVLRDDGRLETAVQGRGERGANPGG